MRSLLSLLEHLKRRKSKSTALHVHLVYLHHLPFARMAQAKVTESLQKLSQAEQRASTMQSGEQCGLLDELLLCVGG